MSTKKTKKTAGQPRKIAAADSSANTKKRAKPRAVAKPQAVAKAPQQSTKRAKRTTANRSATSAQVATRHVAVPSEQDRRARVALAAYFRAEARGFAPGGEVQDWVAAERDIDAQSATS